MELRKRALGIAFGLVWGLAVMLGTWLLILLGSPGGTMAKLAVLYRGYSYTFVGGIIGFIWGFVDGFICGFIVAWIYNVVNKSIKAKATS